MKAAMLLRLYPRAWRERYGEEFLALLHQTGVGWRQVSDVVIAASRERVRALTRGTLSPGVSHQAGRFAGFYSLAWMSVWWIQWMMPIERIQPISFLSLDDHRRLVTSFLISALVSRIVDNWALSDADEVQPPRSTAQAIGALSLVVAVMAVACAGVIPGAVVRIPAAFSAIFTGQWFGRKRGALAALHQTTGPGRPPRPSSITTLGLSA